jgi:hypothetical protein
MDTSWATVDTSWAYGDRDRGCGGLKTRRFTNPEIFLARASESIYGTWHYRRENV